MKDLNNLKKYRNKDNHITLCSCLGIASFVFAVFEGMFGQPLRAIYTGMTGLFWIFLGMHIKLLHICSQLREEIDNLKKESGEKLNRNP